VTPKIGELSELNDMSVYARMGRRAMQSFLSLATFNHELTLNHKIDKIPETATADISGILCMPT
jgi:hypothetical protein